MEEFHETSIHWFMYMKGRKDFLASYMAYMERLSTWLNIHIQDQGDLKSSYVNISQKFGVWSIEIVVPLLKYVIIACQFVQ